jgi:RNA polymerase sigma-70 factor (ECF subfamily)
MPNAEPISREWIDRVRAREEAASRELVERLYPLVLRIVRAHRPQRMAEEDLCQEVFMSLFASLEQYRGSVPFDHWVSRVAVNTCIDHLRRHRSRPELRWADLTPDEALALESLHDGHPATSTGDAVATNDLLEKILASLPPEDRLVIQLMALEQRSVKEVCALTGWSAPLVKVRAFRARWKMRRFLEALLKSEES